MEREYNESLLEVERGLGFRVLSVFPSKALYTKKGTLFIPD